MNKAPKYWYETRKAVMSSMVTDRGFRCQASRPSRKNTLLEMQEGLKNANDTTIDP